MNKKSHLNVSADMCVLCLCASWHPQLGHSKTFLLGAFSLFGRRERLIVPQAHRRRAHSCHTHTKHMAKKQSHTQLRASCRFLRQRIQRREPSRCRMLAHTHGVWARGQRVRRVSVDEKVKTEPGKRWSTATRTALTLVPGSRAENKPGPTSSLWPAALPDSQPGNCRIDHFWALDFTLTNNPARFKLFLLFVPWQLDDTLQLHLYLSYSSCPSLAP